MKYQNIYMFILLILCPVLRGHAQLLISGKILSKESEQPIPYANIGILNTEVGTISNEDGSFSIHVPSQYTNESILFSSLGYAQKSISAESIANQSALLVYLNEASVELAVVNISGQREKYEEVELGNGKSLLLSGQLHYDTLSAGSAMALLINRKDYQNLSYVSMASLYIAKNLSDEFKVRLRFMAVDANTSQPGRDLVNEQIIATSNIQKGWLDFNLNDFPQIEEDSFYVVFEWIMDKDDREYVARKYSEFMEMYPDRVSYDTVVINNEKVSIPKVNTVVAGTIFGVTQTKKDLAESTCYYRSNSFGQWQRSSGILSARVRLSNYPAPEEE